MIFLIILLQKRQYKLLRHPTAMRCKYRISWCQRQGAFWGGAIFRSIEVPNLISTFCSFIWESGTNLYYGKMSFLPGPQLVRYLPREVHGTVLYMKKIANFLLPLRNSSKKRGAVFEWNTVYGAGCKWLSLGEELAKILISFYWK